MGDMGVSSLFLNKNCKAQRSVCEGSAAGGVVGDHDWISGPGIMVTVPFAVTD